MCFQINLPSFKNAKTVRSTKHYFIEVTQARVKLAQHLRLKKSEPNDSPDGEEKNKQPCATV